MIPAINTDAEVKETLRQLLEAGFEVHYDMIAGTVKCSDSINGQIYWALRKGNPGQPWIVRFNEDCFKF